ncbi:MAG: hypothetical protein ABR974_03380 [Bacteroidales bacterium]|jgi:hypothetical protein
MKRLLIISGILFLTISTSLKAQSEWPKDVTLSNGYIATIFQPQPENLNGNRLESRAVVSIRKTKSDDPVFGVIWAEAALLTDKDTRMATMENIKVTQVRFPDLQDKAKVDALTKQLEDEIPNWDMEIPLDEIVATIEQDQGTSSDKLNTDAPLIYYKNEPTTLVVIDGNPIIKTDDQLKMERVMNTPFLIVKCPEDRRFYLYAGNIWYVSSNVETGWMQARSFPSSIRALDTQVKSQDNQKQQGQSGQTPVVTSILVSTTPAELIQTDGEPSWSSVAGTNLLYVSNSNDEIFRNLSDQQIYILLSGRWYSSPGFRGPWSYIAPDRLPADFAKIPEGSDKDGVLSSVAGTDASREAVMDAEIPQTAKVDRSSTINVTYDGAPVFEPIEGTGLAMAVNASLSVIRSDNRYFAVDNGVWYVADQPLGPWMVSTERPADIDKVPATSPVYNTKYVYIYDSTPDYVYVGYTPGYMGCYIYGPTVVYGTGFYYHPWYRAYYYPRPYTWGFGMHYNPWSGWCMNFNYSFGWFNFSWGFGYRGGWWGPPVYRPAYYPAFHPGYGGFYGRNVPHYNAAFNVSHNNIYTNRRDVVTRDVYRNTGTSPNTRPSTSTNYASNTHVTGETNRRTTTTTGVNNNINQPQHQNQNQTHYLTGPQAGNINRVTPKPNTKVPNNVYSDKAGNVYKKESGGNWQQRQNNGWQSTAANKQPVTRPLDKSSYMRDRGDMRKTHTTPSKGHHSGGSKRR